MASAFAVFKGDGEPVEVRVRFNSAAARYVQESRWHASQSLTPLPDGGVLAVFRVSGTEEIKRWILSFGSKAVILGPESLRREVVQELRDLAKAYEGPTDAGEPPSASRTSTLPKSGRRRTRQSASRES